MNRQTMSAQLIGLSDNEKMMLRLKYLHEHTRQGSNNTVSSWAYDRIRELEQASAALLDDIVRRHPEAANGFSCPHLQALSHVVGADPRAKG